MNVRLQLNQGMTTSTNVTVEEIFEASPITVYVLSGLLAVNSVFSVLGNGLILFTFLKEKPLGPPLRIILSHLAVTNILIAAIGEPMVCISGFNLRWVFGEMGRKLEAYIVTACGLMAMGLLGFVSCERYLRVTPGQTFIVSEQVSARVCTVFWIYNVVYASLPFYGIAEWKGEGIGISNSVSWRTDRTVDVVYVMLMMSTGYFLPLTVIVFCYNRILHFVKQAVDVYEGSAHLPEAATMETQLTKTATSQAGTGSTQLGTASSTADSTRINAGDDDPNPRPSTDPMITTGGETSNATQVTWASNTNSASKNDPGSRIKEIKYQAVNQSEDKDPRSRIRAAEKKISNVIAIIIISFFVSWTPYAMVNLLVTFDKAHIFSKGVNATIPAMLAKTSTVWSPIIYCIMNGEVRTANLKTLADIKRRLRILYFGGI